ncbi:leucine-responsive regulatory protein [Roseibium sp. TrichSKD4]|uniref:Lrp/AsnC family transcriptional regulator n=1 Tax=Roseibium sp. TrichSKD4 TaxID=744980 RepID=UPI0001E56836|nr:Lrp/AsnC family transcriptional regulator [Roseibium sp. TrichSKD4]EFO31261.1 leucine-responsive regulatory protein [Roseibium sp. TrichSKD4]
MAKMKSFELDRIDERILEELWLNARITNAELAKAVGLSASPVWNRVKALEEAGIIAGYKAVINQAALGRSETMIVQVTMERHDLAAMSSFERAVSAMPEVVEAAVIAGECDFQLKVAVSGTDDFERFLRQSLYPLPGVRQIKSILVLRSITK